MRASAIVIAVAALASTAAVPLARGASGRASVDTRIVAPLADPSALPGVGRCTSDGACTVTDGEGTRASSVVAMTR